MIVKRGKREIRESARSQARKQMKRTLLFTYFTTLASLVLCCAMFLGTTMAWFTSDVTNTGNVIQVGTLSAELYHVVPASGTAAAQEILLNDKSDYQVFDLSARWTPTSSQSQTLKVVNRGDLNFKYDLSLLLVSTAAAGQETPELTVEQQQALLNSFEVYVYSGNDAPALVDAETGSVAGWVSVGTLDSFLNTEASAAEGAASDMYKEILLYSGELKPNVTIEDGSATPDSVQFITVALRMKDTESTALMGQSFTISVKLTATQTIADGNT